MAERFTRRSVILAGFAAAGFALSKWVSGAASTPPPWNTHAKRSTTTTTTTVAVTGVTIDASRLPLLQAVTTPAGSVATTFQWQQGDATGANFANIAGATSSTYTIPAGDTGHSYRVIADAVTSAPYGVTAVSGTLTKVVDYSTGNFSQWDWGVQCFGVAGYPYATGQIYRGTITLPGTYQTVPNVAQITLPVDANSAYNRVACEGLHQRTEGRMIGSTEFFGGMWNFPSNNVVSGSQGMALNQLNYGGGVGPPISLGLHDTTFSAPNGGIVLAVSTGTTPDSNYGGGSTYFSGYPVGGGYSSRNMPAAGPYYVVPPAQFTFDTWYQVIIKVRWAENTTGMLNAWWKRLGETTWVNWVGPDKTTALGELTGFPTQQLDPATGVSYAVTPADKAGGYTAKPSSPIVLYHANPMIKGTTFDVVAAKLG